MIESLESKFYRAAQACATAAEAARRAENMLADEMLPPSIKERLREAVLTIEGMPEELMKLSRRNAPPSRMVKQHSSHPPDRKRLAELGTSISWRRPGQI